VRKWQLRGSFTKFLIGIVYYSFDDSLQHRRVPRNLAAFNLENFIVCNQKYVGNFSRMMCKSYGFI
jgi:hypothetical protein